MTRPSLLLLTTLALLALPLPAAATTLTTESGYSFDIQDFTFSNGTVGDGGGTVGGTSYFDSYDGAFNLTVNDVFYEVSDTIPVEVTDRLITLPPMDVDGLLVSRIIYVPASGGDYVRYVELVENPGTTAVTATIAIESDLGSDGGEEVTGSATGDTEASIADAWFGTDSEFDGDLALTWVVQANDPTTRAATAEWVGNSVSYSFTVSVPAGERVAVMHFGIQTVTVAEGVAQASAIVAEPDTIYFGLESVRDAIVNWGSPTAPCTGSGACTVPGVGSGTCRAGSCCLGCWDGTRCRSGRGATSCGLGGIACATCGDGDPCSSDVCSAGLCTYPDAPTGTRCDDGLFCTLTDTCDGAGSCGGAGDACDDARSCTVDSCDEATNTCSNVRGPSCLIGGECVLAGAPHPTYPCLFCDPTVDSTDWTSLAEGTACGDGRCIAGFLYAGGVCSADGFCDAPRGMRCPTGACADATTCEVSCSAGSCPSGEYCNPTTRVCAALSAAGSTCNAHIQCATGSCVDGVCCDTACSGTCESCNVPGSVGTCSPVLDATDPIGECGPDRACDGARSCRSNRGDAGPVDGGAVDGGAVDAGPAVDAGASDAGAPFDAGEGMDAGTTPPTTRGGCSASPSRNRAAPLALLGLGAVLWSLRRRR